MVRAVSLSTMELNPTVPLPGSRVRHSEFGRALAQPVLYLRTLIPEAAPKCISGRTSYLRVCLVYHPYPQLIPRFCTADGFGPPPRPCSRDFTLAMGSSLGFGSTPRDLRPVWTRFRCGSGPSHP